MVRRNLGLPHRLISKNFNCVIWVKSPLFVAVIIAGLTAQGFGGSYLYLGYPKTNYSGWLVFVGIFITAVVAGYFGSKMCSVIIAVMSFF